MMDFDFTMLQQIGYIASAILFIYGLKMLSSESSAAKGNMVSSFGMLLAILVTLIDVINPVLMLSACLLYTSPSPRDATLSRMPSSA